MRRTGWPSGLEEFNDSTTCCLCERRQLAHVAGPQAAQAGAAAVRSSSTTPRGRRGERQRRLAAAVQGHRSKLPRWRGGMRPEPAAKVEYAGAPEAASQGVDLDVLGDVIQLLLEIISTIVVKNLPVRWFTCDCGIPFDRAS